MTKFEIRQRKDYKTFLYFQKWSLDNRLSKSFRLILDKHIKEKRVYYAARALVAQGYSSIVYDLKCLGVFKPSGISLKAAVYGLAYPKKVLRCDVCSKRVYRFLFSYCSIECSNHVKQRKVSESIKAWRKSQTKDEKRQHQANIEKSNLRKYGVSSYSKTDESRKRARETAARRTVKQKRDITEKNQRTCLERYGVTNVMYNPRIRSHATQNLRRVYEKNSSAIHKKKQKTMLERYGVSHQIYIDRIRHKIFQRKTLNYKGIKYLYQGYEHYLIRFLVQQGFKVSTKVQPILYEDSVGKQRRYTPDILAQKKSKKLLIEVKSSYTFSWTKKNCIEKLFSASLYSQKQNMKFLVCVVYPKTKRMRVFNNPLEKQDLRKSNGYFVSLR